MFKPFLDAGIHVDEGRLRQNYLGTAASFHNLSVFNTLIHGGANTTLAIESFIDYYRYEVDPMTKASKELFQILLQDVKPFDFKDSLECEENDPVRDLMILKLDRVFPHAPQILFDRQAFRRRGLHGGRDVHICYSYLCRAIEYDQPEIVKLCVDRGSKANGLIGDAWNCPNAMWSRLRPYSWLTLAVSFGMSSCVDVLVKNGANVDMPDGTGTTALRLAQAYVAGEHPRKQMTTLWWRLVDASKDEKTLAILEKASVAKRTDPAKAMIRVEDVSSHKKKLAPQILIQFQMPSK